MGDISDKLMAGAINFAEGHETAAIVRRDLSQAKTLANKHAVPRVYSTVNDLLQGKYIDAVYIATPVYPHSQ